MLSEQRIRSILFYACVLIFLIGLPYILSYAFGYKFNARQMKFTKTGIIAIETQPDGASVYLNGTLLDKKTPVNIPELLPGRYHVKIELEKHYPWSTEVEVNGARVSRLDKVILFPLLSNVKQLNKEETTSFHVDTERGKVYYLNRKDGLIYRSDLEGENFEDVGSLPEMSPAPKDWKLSPDREKIIFFNLSQIAVVKLRQTENVSAPDSSIVLNLAGRKISDVFWHSDSYHLIVVTQKAVEVLEAQSNTLPIELVILNKKNPGVFYDESKDALYFSDSQKAQDENYYDNVYKLELNSKSFPFQNLMRTKTIEHKE